MNTLFKPLFFKSLTPGFALFTALMLASCWPWSQDNAAQEIQSLDYHLRWDHGDFRAEYGAANTTLRLGLHAALDSALDSLSQGLMPPAHAELPPQYQEAFSLFVQFDHAARKLRLEYHEQMVMDPQTHRSFKQTLGPQEYQLLMALLSEDPLVCQSRVEPGMVGPAPKMLVLNYLDQALWVYPSGSTGYDGPGGSEGTRRYLCKPELQSYLQERIRQGLQGQA